MGGSSSGLPAGANSSSGGVDGSSGPTSSPGGGGTSGFNPNAFRPSSAELPIGARIYGGFSAESAGLSPAAVTVGPVYVTNEVDIEALAYRVASLNARRGR